MKALVFYIIFIASGLSFAQEGLVKSYYPNDTLKSEINYERNIRQGPAKFYYENGRLKEELTYVNGRVDGLVKEYDENGVLKEMYTIEEGKRQGPTSYFDDKGKWITDKDFEKGMREPEETPAPQINVKTPQVVLNGKTGTDSGSVKNNINKTEEKTIPPEIKEDNYTDDPSYHSDAEVMPEPKEGMAALQKKLIYPLYAKEHGIQGTVKIRAFIDQNGDVTKAEVAEGIGYGCDDAARITVLYTKFKPGLIRGKPVKTQLIIPLEFKLKDKD